MENLSHVLTGLRAGRMARNKWPEIIYKDFLKYIVFTRARDVDSITIQNSTKAVITDTVQCNVEKVSRQVME